MKKDDKKVAILETLWAGREDWTGLWEVVWRLQTIWPEMRGGPAEHESRVLLRELLDQGFIYLCLLDEDTNRETRLSDDEAVELLHRPDALDAPASAQGQFRFVTTDEGESEIRRLEEAGVRVVW